jgi:hypothetical protein
MMTAPSKAGKMMPTIQQVSLLGGVAISLPGFGA